jgi:hypothetical protein
MMLEIPILERGQETAYVYTLEKMKFEYKRIEKGRKIVAIIVTYEEPMDLVYFGMTLSADMIGIFKTGITR